MGFAQDYKNALPYEELAKDFFRESTKWQLRPTPAYVKGTHPPDIVIESTSGEIRELDVKHDKMSARTGNIFIEEKSLKGTHLMYFTDYDMSITVYNVARLKEWLATKPAGVRHVQCAGDAKKWNGNHGGYIIPVRMLKKLACLNVTDTYFLNQYTYLNGVTNV